ncbi:MAG TPA: Rnf-Nqr domain containing protein [Candidatus Edwardsbacteria bacterium]|nr:Rnf-Nqr domain containing protein [Candidatus Edwardsbacteria bacterium]
MRLPSESKQQLFLKSMVPENAVLFSGLGIMLAVAGTATVPQAFFLGSVALALMLATSFVAAVVNELVQKRTPLWPLVLLAALLLALVRALFQARINQLPQGTAVVLALLAVSPVVYARALNVTASTTVGRALFDAAGAGLGQLAVLLGIGLLRELLGLGTVGASPAIAQPPLPWLGGALGGLLLTAAAIALFRRFKPGSPS